MANYSPEEQEGIDNDEEDKALDADGQATQPKYMELTRKAIIKSRRKFLKQGLSEEETEKELEKLYGDNAHMVNEVLKKIQQRKVAKKAKHGK